MATKFQYKNTDYIDNAVGIHPEECGCTDCILGYSFPVNDGFFSDELAADIVNSGRKLVNCTSTDYKVVITKGEWSDKYRMHINSEVDSSEVVMFFVLVGR